MFKILCPAWLTLLTITGACFGGNLQLIDDEPLQLPDVGAYQLRLLAPTVLELTLITGKPLALGRAALWDFINRDGLCRLPGPAQFAVSHGGKADSVKQVGFKRRVLYAPLKRRDLRIANYLYLELTDPINDNQIIEVTNPDGRMWPPTVKFKIKAEPRRWSPVLHVNQTGYLPAFSKKAMVGYYLGSLGELDIEAARAGAMHQSLPLPQAARPIPGNGSSGPGSIPTPSFQVLEAVSGPKTFRRQTHSTAGPWVSFFLLPKSVRSRFHSA